jgi:hypothetical protein
MNFTLEKLKEARDAGIPDDVIWESAANFEPKFNELKKNNIPLDVAFEAYQKSGIKPQPVEEEGILRQAADIPVNIFKGGVTGVRMVTDVFGASNPLSKSLAGVEGYMDSLLSAQAKRDQQEISRILKDAEDKGVLDQVMAGIEAFSVAPADTLANALGTMIPVLATGLAGSAARLAPVAIKGVQLGMGFAQGVGTAKGEIYNAVYSELENQGYEPETASQIANKAQAYNGKNLDQILISGGLGAAAASTGAEKILTNVITKAGGKVTGGAIAKTLKGGITEAVPEAVQGGQEKLATNIALQREGVDVPTMRGVVAQATMEGVAGLGMGAAVGPLEPSLPDDVREQRNIERDAAKVARELSVDPNDANARGIVNETNRLEQKIENNKVMLSGMEPTSREHQRLSLEIAEDQKNLAALKVAVDKLSEPIAAAGAEQARLAREIAAKSTTPAALSTEVQSGIRSGVASLDPDTREFYADFLTRQLEKKGKLTWQDVPQELNDAMDTIEFGALKQALDTNPQEAISIIAGKPAAPVSETITEPAAPPARKPAELGAMPSPAAQTAEATYGGETGVYDVFGGITRKPAPPVTEAPAITPAPATLEPKEQTIDLGDKVSAYFIGQGDVIIKDKNGERIGRFESNSMENGLQAIEVTFLEEDYRGKGIGQKVVKKLRDIYGAIASDVTSDMSKSAKSMWINAGAKIEQITEGEDIQSRYVLRKEQPTTVTPTPVAETPAVTEAPAAAVAPTAKIESVGENKIYSPVEISEQDTGAYHFGDGGIASDTTMRRMGAGRGTGHYGTGTYFLGSKEADVQRANRPMLNINLAGLNMVEPGRSAIRFHDMLRFFNKSVLQGDEIRFYQPSDIGSRVFDLLDTALIGQVSGDRKTRLKDAMLKVEGIFKSGTDDKLRTPSTYLMQELGFDGIDVRGTEADNTTYGSVVFAKPVLETTPTTSAAKAAVSIVPEVTGSSELISGEGAKPLITKSKEEGYLSEAKVQDVSFDEKKNDTEEDPYGRSANTIFYIKDKNGEQIGVVWADKYGKDVEIRNAEIVKNKRNRGFYTSFLSELSANYNVISDESVNNAVENSYELLGATKDSRSGRFILKKKKISQRFPAPAVSETITPPQNPQASL